MRDNVKMVMSPARKCFCCKIPLKIYRNGENEDIIYFDNQYYHKECFVKVKKVTRKCHFCHNEIDISSVENDFIFYDKHCYHTDCFQKWCVEKNSKKRKMALLNYDLYIDEAKTLANELIGKKKTSVLNLDKYHEDAKVVIKQWFDGSDLCAFVKDKYDVLDPQWDVLSNVIGGTYKNNGIPIPAADLLDMWDRKWDYLSKQNQNLMKKNGFMSADKLIRYDIAILIKKYDSYLKWKREQEILAAENKNNEIRQENIMPHNVIQKKNSKQ